MNARIVQRGQVLVMFVLFLLVLIGISALAIDYASWLLTDRTLQNAADHASLAGASEFNDRTTQGNCLGGLGQQKCYDARAQAWTSLNDELHLGLSVTTINCLSTAGGGDSPTAGETTSARASSGACTSEAPITFGYTIWVTTPPPTYAAYTGPGITGRYAQNFGVMFVRVDRAVRSFLGGPLGITPKPRHGWATAGALPTDYAFQTFCRNNIAPESGVCVNSAGMTIDGQGGIRLVRGDAASNESLTVTSNNGNGVMLLNGNMFLVNRTCASSTWNCPNSPPQGGISDGVNGKNAFYMAPLPVPHYESPINANTVSQYNCNGADAGHLCVPYKDQGSASPSAPGDWTCLTSGATNRCGTPTVSSGTVTCTGVNGGLPSLHYYPISVSAGAANIQGDAGHPPTTQEWANIDDDFVAGDLDTTNPPANPPVDYLYTPDIDIGGGPGIKTITTAFTVNLGAAGNRTPGSSTVRYVAYKTLGGLPDNTGYDVLLDVKLLPASGTTPIAIDTATRTLTNVPTTYEFNVASGLITDYNSLRLQFTFSETGQRNTTNERGGAVSWAEIQHPDPQPATPPMIPPGYYRSISVPANSCAVLDPTGEYSSLKDFQMPGIYRFEGGGNGHKISIGDGSYLVGDGVSLIFDAGWPDAGSNKGIAIGSSGALVLNTMRVPGVPPCTPSETETTTVNMSNPQTLLPFSAVCAAWAVDQTANSGVHAGLNAWHPCDTSNPDSGAHCVNRSSYQPFTAYRGITFYFNPDPGWSTPHASMNIHSRFEMQGGSGTDPGIAFRGVMYAPYDNVKITGGNGFNTVGQVLAWTAKFNGGSAYIDMDYPYDAAPAAPYLLEPTVDH